MGKRLLKIFVWVLGLGLAGIVLLLGLRAYDALRGLPLEPWHTYVPQEMSVAELDKGDWPGYLATEKEIFAGIDEHVTRRLAPDEQIPSNRYYVDSPVYPKNLPNDWNRSYTLEPEKEPRGAVVLLHGLTDSPYSLRHIARRYRDDGFTVVAIRLPGHGTVPAGLTDVDRDEWSAATRLAVREARRRIGPEKPLHLVGFSNGGALALQYALDALEDPALTRPQQLILISPMIGITNLARFAGVFGWPAVFPAFAKASWLSVMPEFNPFKYNSFPVNGARQSSLLTRELQEQIVRLQNLDRLRELPPILTFQSIVDFTVSTRAIIDALYARLPAGRSELVLFDLNRNTKFGPLLSRSSETALDRLMSPAPRNYRSTVISNAGPNSRAVVERTVPAGEQAEQVRPLALDYPNDVFSLSHVALPFPMSDPLYGLTPDPGEDYGVSLGAMAVRGERGILVVSLDSLIRMSANPFYPYVQERIDRLTTAP